MISTLIYSSVISTNLADPAFPKTIEDIRRTAEARNRSEDITGFLFYFDNRFVQILEGDFEAVTTVFSSIRRDTRHEKDRILCFSEHEKRAFDKWSMDCSMIYAANMHNGIGVNLKFLTRFVSDASQQHIKLRDLLIDIANALMERPEYPSPRLVVVANAM